MKKHLFYTFLSVFVVTTAVTLLGVTGVITIKDQYLEPLVYAILVESAGALVALFRAAKFFEKESTSPASSTDHRAADDQANLPSPQEERLLAASVRNHPAAPSTPAQEREQAATTTDAVSLEAICDKFVALKGRFRERDNFVKTQLKRRVVFRGIVKSVSLEGPLHKEHSVRVHLVQTGSTANSVGAHFERALEADLFALREGDVIEVEGTLTAFMSNGGSIRADLFRRVNQVEDQ